MKAYYLILHIAFIFGVEMLDWMDSDNVEAVIKY